MKQITTGGTCHLDARMIERALADWRSGRHRPAVDRKRRQPRLSVELRSRRSRKNCGAQRHRGRGQTAEISFDLFQVGAPHPQQDRSGPTCHSIFRRRRNSRSIHRDMEIVRVSCQTREGSTNGSLGSIASGKASMPLPPPRLENKHPRIAKRTRTARLYHLSYIAS